jgi:hypothetical protein
MATYIQQQERLRSEMNNISNAAVRQVTSKDPGEIIKPRQLGPFDKTTKDL